MIRQSKLALQMALSACIFPAWLAAQVNSTPSPKPGSVTGSVANEVTGEPLAHAHVLLSGFPNTFGAITTVDGRFSIVAIPPGTYTLFAERRGYRSISGSDLNKPIEIKSGARIKDLAVQLVPDAVISGRVLDSNGAPMDNIVLQAISPGQTRYATTDDRGEFRIGGLRQGRYLLKANISSLGLPAEIRTDGTAEIYYAPTYYPSTAIVKSAVPVQAHAGQETGGLDIKLVPSAVLHVSGFISNMPEGPRQNVIASMQIGLMHNAARIGPDFKFVFWQVPPGRHQLFAQYMDSKGKQLRSAPAEINLTNTSIDGLNLSLSQPLELDGQIEVEGGASFRSLKVRPLLRLQPVGSIEHAAQSQTVDYDGTFKIHDIFPGRYYVVGQYLPPGVYVKSARVGTIESLGSVLDLRGLPGNGDLTVLLGKSSAAISGTVRDAKGPVGGVQVAMFFDNEYCSDLFELASVGADGAYSFHGVPPGKYRLLAWDPARSDSYSSQDTWTSEALALYESVIEKIEVSEGDTISQDLKLLTSL